MLVGAPLWGGSARAPATWVWAGCGALALAIVVAEAVSLRQRVPWPPLAILLSALTVVSLAQLVPLPPSLRLALEPIGERLTRVALRGLGAESDWRPLTSDVAATVHEAARLAGLTGFAVAAQRLVEDEDGRWLKHALLISLAALLGAAALHTFGLPLPSPLVPQPATRALASFPFVNPNHAAAFLAALLPLALAGIRRRALVPRWGWIAFAAVGNLALMATLSRAGVAIGFSAEAIALWMILRGEGVFRSRPRVAAGMALAILAVALAAPLWLGRISSRSGPVFESRLQIARDTLPLVRDYALTGVGRGAFELVVPRYSSSSGLLRHAFVENELLQTAADFGVIGALLIFGAAALACVRAVSAARMPSLSSRLALLGVGALVAHNLVDFSWETGGVAAASCALGALAFPRVRPALAPFLGALWCALALGLTLFSASPLGRTAAAAVEQVRQANSPDQIASVAAAAFRRHPCDGFLADVAADRLLSFSDARALQWIDRALLLAPHDPFAHGTAARALAAAGFREQAAVELQAALAQRSDLGPALLAEAVALFPSASDDALLLGVLPERLDVYRPLLPALAATGRWELFERIADQALALAPDDAPLLRLIVDREAERSGTEPPDVLRRVARAERLAAVDASPQTLIVCARGLAAAGRQDEAARLLSVARANGGGSEVEIVQARLALERGDLDGARAIVEDALASATQTQQKRVLHLLAAEVEERSGQPNQAARDRAEAQRLSQH